MKYNKGFTLVELLVGMFVGLMVTLAATSIAIQFGQSQRSGLGSNGATANALASMDTLGYSLRQAGLGVVDRSVVTTPTSNTVVAQSATCLTMNGIANFLPITITAGTNTDTLAVTYSTGSVSSNPVPFAGSGETNNTLQVTSLNNIAFDNASQLCAVGSTSCTGNSVLIIDSASNCTTGKTASVAGNSASFTTAQSYTPVGFIAAIYAIGQTHTETWSVVNSKLQYTDAANNTIVVADNVVGFKVQYGLLDTSGNLTGFSNTGATSQNLSAIRLAIVTKNTSRQKGDVSSCLTSAGTAPSKNVSISDWGINVDVSAIPDWQCYTYKVLTQTYVVKNMNTVATPYAI